MTINVVQQKVPGVLRNIIQGVVYVGEPGILGLALEKYEKYFSREPKESKTMSSCNCKCFFLIFLKDSK